MQSLNKAKLCMKTINERKAIDPVLFEVVNFTSITDYLIIASGNSNRQVQAISNHLQKKMREKGFRALGIEGQQEGHWVLLDYGDIVIHLFYQPVREIYDLEGLWVEALRIDQETDQ